MVHGVYDVAQICLNGHVINDSVKRFPEHNRAFCDTCGEATITNCQECSADIPGYFVVPGGGGSGLQVLPAFCSNCGGPYPWTERGLEAARELVAEQEGLSEEEKATLTKDLDDMLGDTPRATVAATRWKKVLTKVGKEAASAFREIFVDIASETAKKTIWPHG